MPTAASKRQMEPPQSSPPDPREFIRLLMEHERRIFAYIRTILGNSTDAEDVLQETSVTMWDKFGEFDLTCSRHCDSSDIPELDAEARLSRDFIAWSFKIAFFTASNFRRKQGRSKVVFSQALFDVIAEKTSQMAPKLDLRHELLHDCLEKLPPADRDLLRLRYELDASIETTAKQAGRSIQAVYKSLSRMRSKLSECINRGLTLEGQV